MSSAYLDQCMLYIEQIKTTSLRKGREIGRSEQRSVVYALERNIADDIYVALKTRQEKPDIMTYDTYTREIGTIACLYDMYTTLRDKVPLFMGFLKNEKQELLGLLMEDFSQGNKYRVHQIVEEREHVPELSAFCPSRAKNEDREAINSSLFEVAGNIRIADSFLLGSDRYNEIFQIIDEIHCREDQLSIYVKKI